MPKRTDISKILIIGLVMVWCVLPASAENDKRFQSSFEKFAAQCAFKAAEYSNERGDHFTDRDYSNKWQPISTEKLKTCKDCYRSADLTTVGADRVVQLTMGDESGDWLHYINYCFDSAGSLRAVYTDFNCAWGWSYVTVRIYDNGSLKTIESKWQDLKTGNEIARPEAASEMKNHWGAVPVYIVFSNLPFARLLM